MCAWHPGRRSSAGDFLDRTARDGDISLVLRKYLDPSAIGPSVDKMARKAIQKDQIVKLIVGAGQASPSPPVGPALGSKGVKSMDFCKVTMRHEHSPRVLSDILRQGIQRANRKLRNRHASPRPRHRPPRPLLHLRAPHPSHRQPPSQRRGRDTDQEQTARRRQRRGSQVVRGCGWEGQSELPRRAPRECGFGDCGHCQSEACVGDCEDQAGGESAGGDESGGYGEECRCAGGEYGGCYCAVSVGGKMEMDTCDASGVRCWSVMRRFALGLHSDGG